MNDLFEQLHSRQSSILVIGDLMLDQYWLGDTSRISPEGPVPIVKINSSQDRLGGAANAALNAKSLGANVSISGIIGNDANGLLLSQLIEKEGIINTTVSCNDANTITKLRLISRNQQMLRADFEQDFSSEAQTLLSKQAIAAIAEHDIVLLSDYNKGALTDCPNIIKAATAAGKKVIIDPKGDNFHKYKGAFLLTPNMSEFEAIVGKCHDEQDLFAKAYGMIKSYDLEALLLTRSEKGMTLFFKNGEHHHFNTKAREVFDVTGAGDTVIATLTTALASGIDLEQSVMLANTAAGIAVSRMGAATITPLELKLALENSGSKPTGITTAEQLAKLVAFEQSLGKKVVFTNGCFDILHSGHVTYLNEAANHGDRLIVAINDDASVKRLKGEERPINTVDDRMQVISSLAAVDWVVSFSSDTPEPLLELIKPDVLVKGGDYAVEEVVGHEIVRGYGGRVQTLSLQEGASTTNIIDSIKSK